MENGKEIAIGIINISRKKTLAVVMLSAAVLAVLPAALDQPSYQACFGRDGWETPHNFFENAVPQPGDLQPDMLNSPDVRFWRNYDGQRLLAGSIRSAPFELKKSHIIVPIIGSPDAPNAGVFIEPVEGRVRYRLNANSSPSQAQPFAAKLPQALIGRQVRLVAVANKMYLGVGPAFYRTNPALPALEFSKVFAPTLAAFVALALIFYPAYHFVGSFRDLAASRPLATLLLTSLFALALFYVAFYWPPLGRGIVRGWFAISGGLLLATAASSRRRAALLPNIPVGLILGLTAFSALFLFSCRFLSVAYAANGLFYPASWSTDNLIPPATAQLLADGALVSGWGFGGWRPSDRTPLLASLLYPVAVLLRDAAPIVGGVSPSIIVQVCAFGLLHSWVLPVWIIFRRLGIDSIGASTGVLLLAATPFVFFNTIYIWPKMLAATFCLIQLLYLSRPPAAHDSQAGKLHHLLFGSAGGLAIMSHSGAAVAVAGIFLAAMILRRAAAWRQLAMVALITAGIVLPWSVWTKFSVPTSNPLQKYFLTGDFGFSNPNEGVIEAAARTYRSMTVKGWLAVKVAAVKTLAGGNREQVRQDIGQSPDYFHGIKAVRGYQFLFLIPALGFLIIPLIALALPSRGRRRLSIWKEPLLAQSALASVISLVAQLVVMMAPHLLHHYPYFVPLSLQLLAVIAILLIRSRILRIAAALNYIVFVVFWVVLIAARMPIASTGALWSALVLLAGASFVVVSTVISGRQLAFDPRSDVTTRDVPLQPAADASAS